MKVRVKFSKKGSMKFIGHLDVMRYFQKLIRRAGLDVAFTEGFNPHMIMSFASPLGIGLTSDAEYMDIELLSPISSKDAIESLNQAGTEELEVTGFVQIPEGKADKAMTLVAAADYTLRFRAGHEPSADWKNGLTDFFARESIPVMKKTKRSEKEVDIRPMIYEWSFREESETIFLKLASGSVENLKPELVMDTYLKTLGVEPDPLAYEINRCEIYADLGTEGSRKLVSLYELGKEIL
ncbi:MAG: TIGR03936 family radical SAM-associated protein [Lachnospiraceae bacterium]|nr:TIGR03936 family radical SAM-associated protein [Lachnospiraceae bacterium]